MMKFTSLRFLRQTIVFFVFLNFGACATTQGVFEKAVEGESEFIDLSHHLGKSTPPTMEGVRYKAQAIGHMTERGVPLHKLELAEDMGTHIEAPARLVSTNVSVDDLPLGLLMGYGVVIDVTEDVQENAAYTVTRERIEQWESDYGPIPAESILLFRTGWSAKWGTPAYFGMDADGIPHFPGISAEAIDFLVRERRVHALGIDTASIYAGSGNETGQKTFLMAGRYHINNLTNLDRLPPTGSFVVASPLALEDAGSAPARVLAIIPREPSDVEPGKKKVEQETETGMGQQGAGGMGGMGGY